MWKWVTYVKESLTLLQQTKLSLDWKVRWEARGLEKKRDDDRSVNYLCSGSGNLLTDVAQRPFWNQRVREICQRRKQPTFWRNSGPRLIGDICTIWSPDPSISLGSQYFILPHFSERGKYDSTYRFLHKCVTRWWKMRCALLLCDPINLQLRSLYSARVLLQCH